MKRALLAVAALILLRADMYQDASNAKRPEATVNLGVQYTVRPGESIQAALTAASAAGGGTVRVNPGLYELLDGPLVIGSNTSLLCDKGAILRRGPNGTQLSHLYNLNRGNPAKLDHDIVIEGCTFTWAPFLGTGGSSHAFSLWQVRRVTIRNNFFTGGGNGPAVLAGESVVVEGNSHGMLVSGATTAGSAVITGLPCTTSCLVGYGSPVASATGGIPAESWVSAVNSETSVTLNANATITNPAARIGVNNSVFTCADQWDAWKDARVANNYCVATRGGYQLTGSDTARAVVSIGANGTITGNTIELVGPGAAKVGIGLDGDGLAGSGVRNVAVTGNAIRGDAMTDLICFMLSGDSQAIAYSGNTCSDSGPKSWGVRMEAGVGGVPPSNATFIGNIFHNISGTLAGGAGGVAIMQLGGPNVTAIGNAITGTNNYQSLIWAPHPNPVLIGNRGATGIGARYDTSGATNPLVIDPMETGLTIGGTQPSVKFWGDGNGSVQLFWTPASCTGKPTGTLWNDAGTVKLCP